MSTKSRGMNDTYRLTCYGLMTALAFVANYIRFPFLGSQITVSNTLCALCGMILGPWAGFVTAGIGNFLYDLIAGYGIEGLITLVSKGAVALAAGLLSRRILREGESAVRDYRKFLSAGCSVPPIEALKLAGIDMSKPEPVREALGVFRDTVREMREAAGL